MIINYCTNDYQFIKPSLDQVKKFSSEIVITYADHFYNGEKENYPLLKKTISENPKVKFARMNYCSVKPPIPEFLCKLIPRSTNLRPLYGPHYWACNSRLIGYQQLSNKVNHVLFLDTDEIIDGRRFKTWLDTKEYQSFGAISFGCYFYFRSPRHRATTIEGCGLLIKKIKIPDKVFLSHYDRHNIYRKTPGAKKRFALGLDGKPLFHHYAWARGKKGMLKKVQTWGHSQERNWTKLVLKEFSHKFNGTDFLRSYKYEVVKPFI